MSTRISIDAKAYRLTTGSRATWNATVTNGVHVGAAPASLGEMKNVQDITQARSKEKADVSKRAGKGFKAWKGTLKDIEHVISVPYDPADADYVALMQSWLNGTVVALALLSGDKATAGEEGIWADWEVMNMEKGEKLADAQMTNFTINLGDSSVAPEWVQVA